LTWLVERHGGELNIVKPDRAKVASCVHFNALADDNSVRSIWDFLASHRADCGCFAAYMFHELRQAGVWGDYMFKEWASMNRTVSYGFKRTQVILQYYPLCHA
jgi:hypothetical protein